LTEFQNSGLSQADLARRLGKRPEIISRLLGAPGNWGLDTVSDLLFAISGAEPDYAVSYPFDVPARNDVQPHWLGAPEDYSWVAKSQIQTQQTTFPRAWSKTIDPQAAIPEMKSRVEYEDSQVPSKPEHSASHAGLVAA
jgi:hypothetical protein